jgi:hypothetical protein
LRHCTHTMESANVKVGKISWATYHYT